MLIEANQDVSLLRDVGTSQNAQTHTGKTYPDVRMIGLSVYATDKTSANSTMPQLRGNTTMNTFLAMDGFMTDLIAVDLVPQA